MPLTIKRLHELTKAELLALGVFMRRDIQPSSISAGSQWVCQARQQPHYWADSYLDDLTHRNLDIWVALRNRHPVGLCAVTRDGPDRMITLFLVDTRLTTNAQIDVADALALRGIDDVTAHVPATDTSLIIPFRLDPLGDAYATLCGFTAVDHPSIANPRRITFRQLKKNIERRRA